MVKMLAMTLAMAFVSGSALAAAADGLVDCSEQSIQKAGIQHAPSVEAASICEDARSRLHFDLTEGDLQHLIDASVVARLTATKRDFDLPAVTAARYIVTLADLRGVGSDRDAFTRNVDVVFKIDVGTEGIVSPGVLLAQLHAAGPFAKTLSDDGLISFAAVVSQEEKAKAAATSFAAQQPVSVTIAGAWRIIGHTAGGGRIVSCSMFRDAKDGAGEFGYTIMISAVGELNTSAIFTSDTTLPNGSHPTVNVAFDKIRPAQLRAVVQNGRLILSLPENIAMLGDFLNRFQHSSTLRILPVGKPKAATSVDLTGAAEAFDQNGLCMKEAVSRGMSEMKAASGN